MPDDARSLRARVAALESWASTIDRSARTSAARAKSPNSLEYHIARLPEQFADASEQQRYAAAEAARRAYYARLALKSAQARRKVAGDVA